MIKMYEKILWIRILFHQKVELQQNINNNFSKKPSQQHPGGAILPGIQPTVLIDHLLIYHGTTIGKAIKFEN